MKRKLRLLSMPELPVRGNGGRRDGAKVYKKEARSVFGWTDISQVEDQDEANKKESQKSTYELQDSLARLPVPDLEATCKKYLKTLEPLLSAEEMEFSKKAVGEFHKEGGIGQKLQELLKAHDSEEQVPSWLEEWWDDSYLYGRDPIPINVNYFFVFERDPLPEKNSQVSRAASLLCGAMIFKTKLDKEELEPDMERDKPLDMSQYPRLFGSSRIPHEKRDYILSYTKYRPKGRDALSKTTNYVDASPTHVVVLHKNHFFKFYVFKEGRLIHQNDIESNLMAILETGKNLEEVPPVGILTTLDRSDWARARDQLLEENAEILESIQSALFIVCLDAVSASTLDEVSRLVLHGPCSNRWFDKHQLIVDANGNAGVNFEHSVGDGSTTLRLADEMHKWSLRKGSVTPNSPRGAAPVKLEWKLSLDSMSLCFKAYEAFKEAILSNETSTVVFERFGGQFIKDNGISPDAFVQLAIQLAHYRLFGICSPTYEAASTKQLLHGRTETVRSVTTESLAFCKSTTQPMITISRDSKSPNQLQLLKNACNAHVDYMRAAKGGFGVDRHLFGLRILFEEHQQELDAPRPAIFEDPAYVSSGHWRISTSHCGSPALSLFGFGPVVADGFGVGYMIKNNVVSFNITCKYAQNGTSSFVFGALLEQSLLLMQAVVLSNPDTLELPPRSLKFTHPTSSASFSKPPTSPSTKKSSL